MVEGEKFSNQTDLGYRLEYKIQIIMGKLTRDTPSMDRFDVLQVTVSKSRKSSNKQRPTKHYAYLYGQNKNHK